MSRLTFYTDGPGRDRGPSVHRQRPAVVPTARRCHLATLREESPSPPPYRTDHRRLDRTGCAGRSSLLRGPRGACRAVPPRLERPASPPRRRQPPRQRLDPQQGVARRVLGRPGGAARRSRDCHRHRCTDRLGAPPRPGGLLPRPQGPDLAARAGRRHRTPTDVLARRVDRDGPHRRRCGVALGRDLRRLRTSLLYDLPGQRSCSAARWSAAPCYFAFAPLAPSA